MEKSSEHPGSGQQGAYNGNAAPKNLPNANLFMVLGILSIFLCWWHFVSLAGIVLGIIALVLARKETILYYTNPAGYTISSLNNVKTGRICAIIGLSIAIIVFVFVMLLIAGVLASLPFWGMIH